MNELEKIKELQQKVDELYADMKTQHGKLMELQRELFTLQGIENKSLKQTSSKPAKNFKLENFIGLKLIHFVGIIVLVVGLSIGVKYVIDKELISPVMRIGLAYLAGFILYFLAWRLRKKYELFSAILFSGGMASLYFTTYAAFVYYGMFPFALAFALMAAFTIYTCYEAIRYNRQEIAILGMVGAYGIPFLISGNVERVALLFTYMLIINIGVLFLSFKRKWKWMGWLALVTTWLVFILWGLWRYDQKSFSIALFFLVAFYLLFTINALAYRLVRKESLSIGDIQQITTNNVSLYIAAIIVFGYGIFWANKSTTTGEVALIILLFALLSYAVMPSEKFLQQSLAIQSVVFITLFIGLYWAGFMVTLLWVLFAIVLFSWGIYTRRSWPRLTSILLMAVTLGKLVILDSSKFTTIQKIIAYIVIGTLLLILSFYYQKFKQNLFSTENKKEEAASI